MTARIKGFAVTLAEDLRADDAEEIRRALSLVRGVVSVEAVEADLHDAINRERIRCELTTALYKALREEKP